MYLRNRALCYFNMGKWDLAAIDYQNVLRSNPKNARACYFYGLTLLKLNDYDEALKYLQKGNSFSTAFLLYQVKLTHHYQDINQRIHSLFANFD